jgi:hypothetical protein
MRTLIGAVGRRTAGLAAGVILCGGLAGGVLLTPGTAYAQTTTATAITGTTQSAGSNGTTLDVQVSVTPASGTDWPAGNVKVSDGSDNCYLALVQDGSSAVGVGNCSIYNLSGGTYTLTASYQGSPEFGWSASGPYSVNVGPTGYAPAFYADSPSLSATDGGQYSYTFGAKGYPAPSYSLSGPGWLHIDSYHGTVWGTVPDWVSSFSYSVTATNSVGSATAGPYTVYVNRPYNHANIQTSLSCTSRVSIGERGSCTLYVSNTGWNYAPDVSAQIALPWQLVADYCAHNWWNWGCNISDNTAYADLGALNPGQTAELTVVFTAKTGYNLWGWHHGHAFVVKVVGSASTSSGYFWFTGQRQSYSVAWVTITPRGWWW